jgi:hypothetical protein
MQPRLRARSVCVAGLGLLMTIVWLGLSAGPSLAAGLRVDVEFAAAGEGEAAERARIWISERRLRFQRITPGQDADHVLIFRGDQDRFYSIHPAERAYLAVDRQLIADLGLPMLAARREVDSQLAQLPSDQHAALERLLGAREEEGAMTRRPVRVYPIEGSTKIGRYTCAHRLVMREAVKVGEACVVAWSEVGIGPEDLEVLRQLANFQRELMGARELTPLEIVPNQPLDLLVQFDGFPLYLRKWRDGEPRSVIRVTDARPIGPDSASLFEVPGGYRLRSAFSLFFDEGELDVADSPSAPPREAAPAAPAR